MGSQNCLPDEKMALKKALPDRNLALKKELPDGNLALKYHYRMGIRLSNIITRQEFGSQISLPDILPTEKEIKIK